MHVDMSVLQTYWKKDYEHVRDEVHKWFCDFSARRPNGPSHEARMMDPKDTVYGVGVEGAPVPRPLPPTGCARGALRRCAAAAPMR